MCYHYSQTSNKEALEERFKAELQEGAKIEPVYHNNGFQHRAMPVITADDPRTIQLYRWGLIPHFMKTREEAIKISNITLNAIGEEIHQKPSYRQYITKKRCLVLADGLYEWMHAGKETYPHFVYLKDRKPFAFAGIYSHWKDAQTNEVIKTYSIITTAANKLMSKIHNTKQRMPVILHPELERKWLDQTLLKEEINDLMLPYDDELMEAHTITKAF